MVPAIYKVVSLAELVALPQMQIYQAHGIRAIVEGETVWVPDAVLIAMDNKAAQVIEPITS
jgi:hypothetical protein